MTLPAKVEYVTDDKYALQNRSHCRKSRFNVGIVHNTPSLRWAKGSSELTDVLRADTIQCLEPYDTTGFHRSCRGQYFEFSVGSTCARVANSRTVDITCASDMVFFFSDVVWLFAMSGP